MSHHFNKYKLVPVGKTDTVETVEKGLRNYDPKLRLLANAYIASKRPIDRRLPAKTRLKIMNANQYMFQELMRQKLNEPSRVQQQQQQQVMDMLQMQFPQAAAAPVQIPTLPPALPPATRTPAVAAELEMLMKNPRPNVAIPKKYATKYENLIKLASDSIGVGDNGEVVIRGREVANSSYSDVMRALYSDTKGKAAALPGLSETVGELKRLNVPSSMITSSRARAIYQSVGQKGSGKCYYYGRPKMLRLY